MTVTTTAAAPDFAAIKEKQQKTWASGDFAVIASRIVLVSEVLADSADIRAGSRVLDVACGNGNAAIAAARSGAHVVGVDYVPSLLESGRVRVAAEGLDVELVLGDAEELPVAGHSFDTALSVFGTMFAPDHDRTAAELVRVVRPGGTVGLASWTPDGFIGAMFRVITKHVPPPAGVQSPLLWGTPDHLAGLFGYHAASTSSTERTCTLRFESAEQFVTYFRRWYGPTVKAFEVLDAPGRAALYRDLVDLVQSWSTRGDKAVSVPATYLETVIRLR